MNATNNDNPAPFRFTKLTSFGKQRTNSLSEVMDKGDLSSETWLFVSPHDDDLCVGAGMLMQAAVREGVNLQVLVVTDGCMGYCREDQQSSIIQIRREETFESFAVLGIAKQHVTYIGYPDGGLTDYVGRRPAHSGEQNIEGYVGLENAFTYYLRKFRPTRVFVPTHTDLHPDHQITNRELMVSLFHAQGAIWPELGLPLTDFPKLSELAVYCPFSDLPNLEIIGSQEVFNLKLKSIEAYRSQVQIATVVESLRQAGPYEYIRDFQFRLFSPEIYKSLFA